MSDGSDNIPTDPELPELLELAKRARGEQTKAEREPPRDEADLPPSS